MAGGERRRLSYTTSRPHDLTRPQLFQHRVGVSPIDNVQHARADLIPAGHDALEVRLAGLPAGQSGEDFAVAWQVTITPVPEPGGVFLVVVVGFAAARSRSRRDGRHPQPGALV